jgi:hypothetical protein
LFDQFIFRIRAKCVIARGLIKRLNYILHKGPVSGEDARDHLRNSNLPDVSPFTASTSTAGPVIPRQLFFVIGRGETSREEPPDP